MNIVTIYEPNGNDGEDNDDDGDSFIKLNL